MIYIRQLQCQWIWAASMKHYTYIKMIDLSRIFEKLNQMLMNWSMYILLSPLKYNKKDLLLQMTPCGFVITSKYFTASKLANLWFTFVISNFRNNLQHKKMQ